MLIVLKIWVTFSLRLLHILCFQLSFLMPGIIFTKTPKLIHYFLLIQYEDPKVTEEAYVLLILSFQAGGTNSVEVS